MFMKSVWMVTVWVLILEVQQSLVMIYKLLNSYYKIVYIMNTVIWIAMSISQIISTHMVGKDPKNVKTYMISMYKHKIVAVNH